MANKRLLICILGPTCVGKTDLSFYLANKLRTEIISVDSRKFYKELKIGTAIPSVIMMKKITHHFIGHLSIHQYYNAKLFEKDSIKIIEKLFNKYKYLIMTGGSCLYEKAVTEGLSNIPNIKNDIKNKLNTMYKKYGISYLQKKFLKIKNDNDKIDINNPRRLLRYLEIMISTGYSPSFYFSKNHQIRRFSILKIGIILPKKEIYNRICKRVNNMIKIGLLQEAYQLYKYKHLNSLKTIGYKEIFELFIEKKYTQDFVAKQIKNNTQKYAKRQITWYKKDNSIIWMDPNDKEKILNYIYLKYNQIVGNTGFEPVTSCL